MVYAGPGAPGDGTDIFLYDFLFPGSVPRVIAGGPGDQDSPDVSGSIVAYRGPTGIRIRQWANDMTLRTASDPNEVVSAPTIGVDVAAWELGPAGSRDIVVDRFNLGQEYVLRSSPAVPLPGDQHGPSASGSLVAYIDEATGGSVWIHESNPLAVGTTFLCPGRAIGVALGEYQFHTIAALSRAADGHDEDVEVRDLVGELAALRVPGVQRNPHVSGAWVAFEDLSTGRSQVVLWQWTTGLVFVPHPSESQQTLNDLYAGEGLVRVVFADDAAGNLDVALYELTVLPSIPDDGLPSNWPPQLPPPPPPVSGVATCEPGGGDLLATLTLGRDGASPEAGEVPFDAPPVSGTTSLPVLLCIDAARVSAAWVALDDEAVARPCDFNPDVVHLEVRSAVDGGRGRVSGVIAGKPGAVLAIRVIADPARAAAPGAAASPALQADPGPASRQSGCGSGGMAGLGSLAALALVLLRRRS